MVLALSDDFNKDYFVKSQDLSIFQIAAIKLSLPFHLPKIIKTTAFARTDKNYFTNRKHGRPLSGLINVSSNQKPIDVVSVKETTKKLGITINDFVLCGLTTALN